MLKFPLRTAAIFFILLNLTACYGTAEGDCSKIAEAQCDLWQKCKCSGRECQFSHHHFDSRDTCVDSLTHSCLDQASSLNNADSDVSDCLEAVKKFTCEDVRTASALNAETRPNLCAYFY